MEINQETRERIVAAANQLFEQGGRGDFPTVDAVRKLSRTNMNDASAVMKEWRRMQTATAAPVAVAVPDRVQQASYTALAALWGEAQEIANESLNVAQAAWEAERTEAEKLRVELSSAFEAQVVELEALQGRFADFEARTAEAAAGAERVAGELRGQLAAMAERTSTAEARAVEIERRADDLKVALATAQEAAKTAGVELEAERQRHEAATIRLDATVTELVTVKARAEAEREGQAELKKTIGELRAEVERGRQAGAQIQERAATAEARAGEIEKRADNLNAELARVNQQNTELVRALAEAAKAGKSVSKVSGKGTA
jgi:colicin import membrane protein